MIACRPAHLSVRRSPRTSRLPALVAAAVALCACGGGGGSPFADPDSVTFRYGAPEDASGSAAVREAEQGVANARAELDRPGDTTVEALTALVLAFLPVSLSADAFPPAARAAARRAGAAAQAGLAGAAEPWASCVTAGAAQVQFRGCEVTTDVEDWRVTTRFDGTLSRTGSTVAWDMSVRENGRQPEAEAAWTVHLTGRLEVGARQVLGFARSDNVLVTTTTGRGPLRSVFTDNVDLSLGLDDAACPEQGALELKELYVEISGNREVAPEYDRGVRYQWQGCGQATVAYSL